MTGKRALARLRGRPRRRHGGRTGRSARGRCGLGADCSRDGHCAPQVVKRVGAVSGHMCGIERRRVRARPAHCRGGARHARAGNTHGSSGRDSPTPSLPDPATHRISNSTVRTNRPSTCPGIHPQKWSARPCDLVQRSHHSSTPTRESRRETTCATPIDHKRHPRGGSHASRGTGRGRRRAREHRGNDCGNPE